jgi:hypothetical protein
MVSNLKDKGSQMETLKWVKKIKKTKFRGVTMPSMRNLVDTVERREHTIGI